MKSINSVTPINNLSYGITSFNLLKELDKKGYKISWWPIGQIESQEKYHNMLKMWRENALFPDWKAPCLRIFHQNDMSQFVGRGTKIGFVIFELDRFTQQELHHLSVLDRIIVPSRWARSIVVGEFLRVFNRDISDKVNVVPLGIDPEIFHPPKLKVKRKETIFLITGKFEKRKLHDILPQIFLETFSPDDEFELWVMCDCPFRTEEQNQQWKQLYLQDWLASKVKFIPRQQTQEDIVRVYQQIDCLVSPSRAEGTNLPILECMACGKQIITTNYSGHTEYCNEWNSYLIKPKSGTEVANDGVWFHGTGQWMKFGQPEIEQLKKYLKLVYDRKKKGQNMANSAGSAHTGLHYTWENSAKKLLEVL